MDLEKYCMIIDDVLDNRVCDYLIDLFDTNKSLHERYDNNDKPNFTQFNITKHKDNFLQIHDHIIQVSLSCLEKYKKAVSETSFWPKKYMFEEFRIKYYNEGGHDQFDTHIDSGNIETSKRFFIFFYYLNDVEDGGETEFTNTTLKVKPKTGRIIMFPPFWMFPHKGNPVTKGQKYLLSSYLHYGKE